MAEHVKLQPVRTYATEANAIKAVTKKMGDDADGLWYFVQRSDDGRFFPVFVGERAIQRGVHFHFNVVG